MAGAIKFNPSFEEKIENVITNYLNTTFELWYIANWTTILLSKTQPEYDDLDFLKSCIRAMRKKYPKNVNINRLSYKDIEKYFEEFKKLKTIYKVYKSFLKKYDVHTILEITANDIPTNYLKILNVSKMSVKFKISYNNRYKRSYGFYTNTYKQMMVLFLNIFREYQNNYNDVKNTLIYIVRHEYIHHLQYISKYKFAMRNEYPSPPVLYSTFETDFEYANHFLQNQELYPLIDTYSQSYQHEYDVFSNELFRNFLKQYTEIFKIIQQENPKKYKIFISALYSNLNNIYPNIN